LYDVKELGCLNIYLSDLNGNVSKALVDCMHQHFVNVGLLVEMPCQLEDQFQSFGGIVLSTYKSI
jgi:hypothetical protein